jgi:hypothetical protein
MTFTNPFAFVDSQYGSASTGNIKNLVNVVVDRKYHKQVQKKTLWEKMGLIGPDTYSEGGPRVGGGEQTNSLKWETAPGYPVIRKTDLAAVSGDTIKMGLRKNLADTLSVGVTAGNALVDSEEGWDFNDQIVKIEQIRRGVATKGGINAQRNPYESFEAMEMDLLADANAQMVDNALTITMHHGFAPHLFRQYDTTNMPPTAVLNTIYGNDQTLDTTRTIANMAGSGDDNINAKTLELGDRYCRENNFDPVMVNGQPLWFVPVSAAAFQLLMRDQDFRLAMQYARERGQSNPLFNSQDVLVYSNCAVFRYDKIRTLLGGKDPAGLTVASAGTTGTITQASYTGIGGGVTAAQLHPTYFLGANAISLAEGPFKMAERIRKEDDYQSIIGRAIDSIYGTKRNEFKTPGAVLQTSQAILQIVNTVIQ